MVPVELKQESSRDFYRLVLFEDEIALNPTLAQAKCHITEL